MTKPKAARNDRFQRRVYPIPQPGTTEIIELPSVSRLEDVLYSYALENWKLTTVAAEMAKRKDLVILAATDPKEAYRQALGAAQRSANVGNSVHALSEQYEDGVLNWELVNDEARPWLESYIKAKEVYGWTPILQEATVYSFQYGYAGTCDRFMQVPGYGVCVVDLKTGKGVYGSSALQLSMYAHAEGIWEPPASCPEATKLRRQLEEDIQSNMNVPTGRRGWSKAAQDAEHARIEELYWEEYARLGKHLPMPEGLRTDVAFLLHLYGPDPETNQVRPGELIPVRLEEDLVRSISYLFYWSNDRTILGDPVVGVNAKPDTPVATESSTPEAAGSDLYNRAQELAARARKLPQQLQQSLKEAWPAGAAGLKAREWISTAEEREQELLQIEELIAEREALAMLQEEFPGAVLDEPKVPPVAKSLYE